MIKAEVTNAGDGFVEIDSKDILMELCLMIQEVYNATDEMSINDLFRAIEIATDIEIRNLEYVPNDASLYLS
jgi:hypothetical protein